MASSKETILEKENTPLKQPEAETFSTQKESEPYDLILNLKKEVVQNINENVSNIPASLKNFETQNFNSPEDIKTKEQVRSIQAQIISLQENTVIKIETTLEKHVLYSALSNPEILSSLTKDEIELLGQQMEVQREDSKKFKDTYSQISNIADKNKKIEAISNLLEDSNGIMPPEQLATLFNTLKDAGSFDKMIDLYNGAKSEIFKQSPIIKEFMAVAYHKRALKF